MQVCDVRERLSLQHVNARATRSTARGSDVRDCETDARLGREVMRVRGGALGNLTPYGTGDAGFTASHRRRGFGASWWGRRGREQHTRTRRAACTQRRTQWLQPNTAAETSNNRRTYPVLVASRFIHRGSWCILANSTLHAIRTGVPTQPACEQGDVHLPTTPYSSICIAEVYSQNRPVSRQSILNSSARMYCWVGSFGPLRLHHLSRKEPP